MSLYMKYRIVHHLIAIPSQIYLTPATTRITRGHDQTPFSIIQSHQNAYFPSAIRTWNNLSAVLISVSTLEAFKVELAQHTFSSTRLQPSFFVGFVLFSLRFLWGSCCSTFVFCGVRVVQSLVLCVVFGRSLFVLCCHFIISPSIYDV